MEQIYLLPDVHVKQAEERMERLRHEAAVYRLGLGPSWRKRAADVLVRVAGWLEPTLQTSSLDEISPNLTKH